VLLKLLCDLLSRSPHLFLRHRWEDTDLCIAADSLQIDGNTNVSNIPPSLTGRWAKCRAEVGINSRELRDRKKDGNSKLVLNIPPLTANGWQSIGGDGPSAGSKRTLKDELSSIATTLRVALAPATTKQRQNADSQWY